MRLLYVGKAAYDCIRSHLEQAAYDSPTIAIEPSSSAAWAIPGRPRTVAGKGWAGAAGDLARQATCRVDILPCKDIFDPGSP